MHETRTLGSAQLMLYAPLKSQISFSDFCLPAGTITFVACDGFLSSSLILFSLSFPGYVLEAKVRDGQVFIKRNNLYQHSEQYIGLERCTVAIQWDSDSIACGINLVGSGDSTDQHLGHAIRARH
jgi:hypothetical protein